MAFLAALPEVAEAIGIGGAAEGGAAAGAGGAEAGGMESMNLPGRGLFNDRRQSKGGGGSEPAGALGNVKAAQGA